MDETVSRRSLKSEDVGSNPTIPAKSYRTLLGEAIVPMLQEGKSYNEIARTVGCSKSTITWWSKRASHLPAAVKAAQVEHDWKSAAADYESGLTAAACRARYSISRGAWYCAIVAGKIISRGPKKADLKDLLKPNSGRHRGHIKKRLQTAGLDRVNCDHCGLSKWMGQELSLHLHHKNGIGNDHSEDNLEWLCPNCHSLTDTYAGRNSKGSHGKEIQAASQVV